MSEARTVQKGHGRLVVRRLNASTRLAEHLDWPGLKQVGRLERTTTRRGQVTLEDPCRVTTGAAAQNLAPFHNAAITLLRLAGFQEIAPALRNFAYQPRKLLRFLVLMKNRSALGFWSDT